LQSGRETGVGRQAGVSVDFKNPGLPVVVDSKINTSITLQIKGVPTATCQGFKFI
jgi:hypothetical protein